MSTAKTKNNTYFGSKQSEASKELSREAKEASDNHTSYGKMKAKALYEHTKIIRKW